MFAGEDVVVIADPEFVKPALEMNFFFQNGKKYFIFRSMLPK